MIDANGTRSGLLVLTDDFYPGWRPTVDGHPVPLRRVDFLLRGVMLPPGHHTVVMGYAPTSWTAGWVLSSAALMALLLAVALGLRRRGRRGSGEGR